jgi:hypothetical protein
MQRWEFDSIARAASCISSWFSGTPSERLLLKEYLDSAIGILLSFYILGQRKNNLLLFLDTCRSAMPYCGYGVRHRNFSILDFRHGIVSCCILCVCVWDSHRDVADSHVFGFIIIIFL